MSFTSRIRSIFEKAMQAIGNSITYVAQMRSTAPFVVPSSPMAFLQPIYTRIAIDVALQTFKHGIVNKNGTYMEEVDSELSYILQNAPNSDQTPITFFLQAVLRLLHEGVIAIVPTAFKLAADGNFADVMSLRVCTVLEERAQEVRVDVYNDETGLMEQLTVDKTMVAIIENPLRTVMSENNQTLKRLLDKIFMLDTNTRKLNSGKLDMIIQLPYSIKTPTRKQLVDERMKELEEQLSKSDLGIAYAENSERIVQLNRAVGGNLLQEVADLTTRLHQQLGITESLMVGEASEIELNNYFNRTIIPITRTICEAMSRTFIPRFQQRLKSEKRQKVVALRSLMTYASLDSLVTMADTMTRNEILTPNEIRAVFGYTPSGDPDGDQVRNRNIREDSDTSQPTEPPVETESME